ncbi:DNA polymerase III subunit epsilon [Sphingomonas aliaeris]|uniref:DNA polymerase III subunit epsilon n=1 Tax=Sphingomonas aliaeris TaxID=2759526 RepID=A0A974NUN9_9SPHN|nr:DNA polymerase III subunit epsilon [Sphingomonas aliaeris]QQV77152.1 DNA polymerase III subunit epsilon [Sphingomonas aliaeris]
MREIVFDTETTGFSFKDGDRMVEIGCVELINKVETGRTFHAYFHPERTMPAEAQRIHGLSDVFLSDKPLFHAQVEALLEFLGDAPLVAHNASFDFGFLNGELTRCGRGAIDLARMVDTIVLARARHPGAKHSLDALCSRYGIDRSHRIVHGALLDAQLLSQVYVELSGGRQIGLGLVTEIIEVQQSFQPDAAPVQARPARVFSASEAELARHAAFIAKLTNPIWGTVQGGNEASG